MTSEAQSLLSHAPRFFFERVNFLFHPIRPGFLCVRAAQLVERLLNREFGCFSHSDLFPLTAADKYKTLGPVLTNGD
jgi:hypothetical protein